MKGESINTGKLLNVRMVLDKELGFGKQAT